MIMSAVSTCTRLRVGGLEPLCMPFTQLREIETNFRRLQFFGMRKTGLEPIFNVLGHTSIFLRLFSHSKSQPWTYLCNPDFLCYFRHYPRPFSVCKGCAGLINIIHSDILCDHVPDFNIDGFNVFSLAFWKATSKTFRALNSLHFSFALSRKCKSSIYYHNYFMSESPRRFFLQQPFTAYRAADVPVI